MAPPKHLGLGPDWLLLRDRFGVRCGDYLMAVVDFEDLQLLSGYKQVSKVLAFLRENKIRYVVGGDGRPRTTNDMLAEDLRDERREKTAEIRFT